MRPMPYIVTVVPDYLVRFVLWLLTHSVFRIRINGQENVPFEGPALLVANHMSHVDGLLVGASVQRFIRFMVWKPFFEMRAFHRSEEHTSELQSLRHLVCRLLLEKKD